MKSRSRAGAASKPRRRKPAVPKRPSGTEAARPRSPSATGQETDIAQLSRELAQARQEQTATGEVLSIISSSPGALTAVFDTILANALRLCEADTGQCCAPGRTLCLLQPCAEGARNTLDRRLDDFARRRIKRRNAACKPTPDPRFAGRKSLL
jgi:hypothetical protein